MHLTYHTPRVDSTGDRPALEDIHVPPELIAAGVEFLENSAVASFMTIHPEFVSSFIIHLMRTRLPDSSAAALYAEAIRSRSKSM